ncbi:MAG: hypothetical protein QXK84_07245 [Nitrososphaerota archaeon]
MSAAQRIALSGVVAIIIAFGLVLAGLNWPRMGEILYVKCNPLTGECATTTQLYRIGNEGAVFLGVFLVTLGLIILSILLLNYVRLMFSSVLRRLRRVKLLKKLA